MRIDPGVSVSLRDIIKSANSGLVEFSFFISESAILLESESV